MRFVCLPLLVLFTALPASAAPITFKNVTYTVNHPLDPALFTWLVSDVGWAWTPTETFRLISWSTRFLGGGAPRTITAEIWDAPPALGGTLLASDDAHSAFFGGLYQLEFPWIELTKGEDYFFGFKNVQGFGVNITDEPGAVSLGTFYFSFGGAGDYALMDPSPGIDGQPLLRFSGLRAVAVPEPALSGLLVLAGAALFTRMRRTRRSP